MPLSQKICDIDNLALRLEDLRRDNNKIILCHGIFDLVHPGHVKHFQAAKALGHILVVTITPDIYVNKGPGRPMFAEILRAEIVAELQSVDYVAINKWPTAVETIKKLRPHIYVKGKDYTNPISDETGGIVLEKEAVESVGGRMHFTDEITFSSSSLLNEYFGIYPKEAQEYLKSLRRRYTAEEVIGRLNSLRNLRTLVIGETIFDEYHHVAVIGKPPKGNHIAAQFVREEVHAGGILACANNMANFCGNVDLITTIERQDRREEFIKTHLKPNINLRLFYSRAPTIVKRRFVNRTFLNKLFEIYVMNDLLLSELETEILAYLSNLFSTGGKYDLIFLLDYGHGMFTPALIDFICDQNYFLAVNAQTNTANAGYNLITKYRRANYFCLDDQELRLAFGSKHGDIKKLLTCLAPRISLPGAITVTRGHFGSITFDIENQSFFEAPVLSQKIIDTTGAGDALFSVTAPCVAAGFPLEIIPFIGNAVGALAVGVLGNQSSIEKALLYKFIMALLK